MRKILSFITMMLLSIVATTVVAQGDATAGNTYGDVANFQEIEEPEIEPASGTLDLSFTKESSSSASVTVTGNEVPVGTITSTITSNYSWKSLTADNATFPNASIVCPDKNTKDMYSGYEGTITITLNNVPEGYSFKNVTFTSAAINGQGAFQGDDVNAQLVNMTLKQGDNVIGTAENVKIKVDSNSGESVVVPFEVADSYTATDGTVVYTLVIEAANNSGCFYGLVGVSLETEVASTPEPAVTYTVTVSSAAETMGTATATATGDVEEGTEVTFTATPATGYEFLSWMVISEAGFAQVTENPYTTTITENIEVVANYQEVAPEEWPATIALIERANELIAKEGVGFPNAEAKAAFQAVIDEATATPTKAMLTPLQNAINAYYATDAITQPTAGEVYAFISEGYYANYYMYNNAGTLALAACDNTTVLPESAYFVCEYDEESGKYQFKTIDGAYYLAYPSPGKTWLSGRSETGLETTSSRLTQFEIGTLTVSGVLDQYLFGFVHLWGYRGYEVKDGVSSDFVGPMVVKSEGTFDGAGGDFYDYSVSSAFSVVEVEYEVLDPAIVVTYDPNGAVQLRMEVNTPDTKLNIDWGDGNIVETAVIGVTDPTKTKGANRTEILGTALGDGEVKIYGEGITYFNISKTSRSTKVKALDITNAPDIKYLYSTSNLFTEIDLSNNSALEYISLGGTPLESIDLSSVTAPLTAWIDYCGISEIKVSESIQILHVEGNNLTFATLPVVSTENYSYTPQNAMTIVDVIEEGESIDLSAQNASSYIWKTVAGDTQLVAGTDYTEANGVFTFNLSEDTNVYCSMTSTQFPELLLETTATTVKASSTGIEGAESDKAEVYAADGKIYVNGFEGTAQVVNISGQVVKEVAVMGNAQIAMPQGIYFVVTASQVSKVVVK